MTRASRSVAAHTSPPPAILLVAIALLLLSGLGPNAPLVLVSLAVLLIGNALLWRPGESPVFLLVFVYQWLQASAQLFHASFKGVDVAVLSYGGGQVALATILSLLALVMLAMGMRVGAGPWRAQDGQLCRSMALSHDLPVWFRIYAVAWAGGTVVLMLAQFVPGLSQPLLAAAALKWAFFWMLAYATFVRPSGNRTYLLIAFGFEFVIGISGFFSDFRTVFFVTLLAVVAAGARISGARLLALSALTGLLLFVGLVWTAVKSDYRAFLNGGQAEQVVNVGFSERITRLAELVTELDAADLGEAADNLVNRIGYVDFFAVVLDVVPATVPHENGALWWDAISRPFMPRLFFPEKSAINDSDRTNYYTGLGVRGIDSGTSISIGYVGESYIDFGANGMMIVIFLYGFFLGRCYRWYLHGPRARGLLGMALISAVLISTAALESSITKVMGGVVVSLLVAWLLVRFGVPAWLPWLSGSRAV